VRLYVRSQRRSARETFIPLDHETNCRKSKWLVFKRHSLAGFGRPLTLAEDEQAPLLSPSETRFTTSCVCVR